MNLILKETNQMKIFNVYGGVTNNAYPQMKNSMQVTIFDMADWESFLLSSYEDIKHQIEKDNLKAIDKVEEEISSPLTD